MYAVIRIKGPSHIRKDIEITLKLLRLHKANHCVLVPEKKEMLGMLKKCESAITWGKISEEMLTKLLEKRGRIIGNKKITEKYLKEKNINNFKELAKQLIENKIKLQALGIKPVFRLKPPSKGFERGGIKKSKSIGGALGKREEIDSLLRRMI
jgi:large subunit ribosomal protein L30